MVLLLSGRPEVRILLATYEKYREYWGCQSSRYFFISKFANQNSVSANYPKNFVENLANWKGESFRFKVINFVTSWDEVIDYFILFFYEDGEIMSISLEKCMIYCKNRQRAYIKLGIPIWNFKFKDIQRSRTWSRNLRLQVWRMIMDMAGVGNCHLYSQNKE